MGRRFGAALGVSLAVHLALLFGVKVVPSAGPDTAQPLVIQARLAEAAAPRADAVPRAEPAAPSPVPAPQEPPAPNRELPAPAPRPAPPAPPSPPSPEKASPMPAVSLPLAEDPTYYPASQVDVHPLALQKIEPAYPDRAADMGVEGEVTLLLLVDEYGVVREASVADAKPEGWFEDSTLAAFKNARFRPAERKGRAVKSRVLIRVTYELNGGRPGTPKAVR